MSLIDRRLLDIRLSVQKIANAPDENPTAGIQYIVGSEGTGVFENIAPNSIAWFDGTNWKFAAPSLTSTEVLNLETGEILSYNGTAWTAVISIPDTDDLPATPITETHSLNVNEINAKAFTLQNSVKSGQENNVLLFISGVAQVVGVDFTVSGNSIGWDGKGLASIDLHYGDVLLIHYVKA